MPDARTRTKHFRSLTGTALAVILGALAVTWVAPRVDAKVVNRIVAIVNEEVITQGDLDRLIREHIQALREYEGRTLEEARGIAESAGQARLDDLVASTLLEQEARRQEQEDPTIQITQLMLDDAIQAFRDEQELRDEEQFQRALGEQGYTTVNFRREMLRSLRIRELFRREIFPLLNVTEDEVTAYYEAHLAQFADKQAARDNLREQRFAEERERTIASLRKKSFVQTLVTF